MSKRKIQLILVAIVAVASALLLVFWRRPADKTPDVDTDPRTAGTRAMALRLDAIAHAWESKPFVDTPERSFRANRPSWIPALRQRATAATSGREALKFRSLLAQELLQSGANEEALATLNELYQMIAPSPVAEPAKSEFLAKLRSQVTIALIRQGEQLNCIARHNPDSCLFPLRGGGIHQDPTASRGAIEVLSESLRIDPSDLEARWLLNLAHMTIGDYPQGVPTAFRLPPTIFASEHDPGRFVDVAAARGVDTVGLAGGCCVDDFDGDGDLDIFASSWGLRDQLRYLRQEPDGKFTDRTTEAGLGGLVGGLNLSHADYDNDGLLDVLVLRGAWLEDDGGIPNSLLRNLGDGRFDDVTEAAGLLSEIPSHAGVWGDYDNDGWIDLFVGGEQKRSGVHRCRLYHNQKNGTFRDVAVASEISDLGFVKGAAWGDFDNDGFIDLYVSRIDKTNVLLRNSGHARKDGGWTFQDFTERAGVGEPRFSFPAWFWDYDNDGWLDIFVAGFDGASVSRVAADYLGNPSPTGHPKLYRNRGDGTFEDVTSTARLDRVLLIMGANHGDLDNDGYPDLYLGTGAPDFRTLMPNRMFRSLGGATFQDVTTAGGFGHLQKGHGIAFADIDGDGDQDIYAVQGGWYTADTFTNVLFENPGNDNHWLTLRLVGSTSNRAGIGARIHVRVRRGAFARSMHQLVDTGGSFGSTSLQAEIGLGKATSIERIEVRWPASGKTQVFEKVEMDRAYVVREGVDALEPVGR